MHSLSPSNASPKRFYNQTNALNLSIGPIRGERSPTLVLGRRNSFRSTCRKECKNSEFLDSLSPSNASHRRFCTQTNALNLSIGSFRCEWSHILVAFNRNLFRYTCRKKCKKREFLDSLSPSNASHRGLLTPNRPSTSLNRKKYM